VELGVAAGFWLMAEADVSGAVVEAGLLGLLPGCVLAA
jgi:hypothetical protein